MSALTLKSEVVARTMAEWARANPRKRGLVYSATEASAHRTRELLALANGGARPFNVRVEVMHGGLRETTDG